MKQLLCIPLVVLSLTCGCGSMAVAEETKDKSAGVPAENRSESIPSVDMNQETGPVANDVGMQRLIELAKEDLASRLSVDAGSIEVLEAQYVTWRDSSAGCVRPGEQARDVITNGTRIRLKADGRVFSYHSGGNKPPFLCESPSQVDPLPYEFGDA